MAKIQIKKGTTSKLLDIFIQDSSSTTGAGLTGLTYASSGLTAYYYREGAAGAVAITLATMTLGTWVSGGFIVVDGTNMPGCYQLGIPDAALAAGASSIIIMLKGATNTAPLVLEIQLMAFDPETAIAQTGDAYAIVNHASYGNAQLVRSTIPANTLDVSATGEAGLDFANIKQATGATTLNNITVPMVTTLTNAPVDSSGVTTLLTRIPSEAAQKSHLVNGTGNITPPTNTGIWDRVDAAVSSRASATDYTTARAVKMDNLDVSVGSRLAASGYTAPDNTTIGFIQKWILNKLVEGPSNTWKLYDDDSTTVLKTWTWDPTTTTRSKAV